MNSSYTNHGWRALLRGFLRRLWYTNHQLQPTIWDNCRNDALVPSNDQWPLYAYSFMKRIECNSNQRKCQTSAQNGFTNFEKVGEHPGSLWSFSKEDRRNTLKTPTQWRGSLLPFIGMSLFLLSVILLKWLYSHGRCRGICVEWCSEEKQWFHGILLVPQKWLNNDTIAMASCSC